MSARLHELSLAVLFGGHSGERAVSIASADAVIEALRSAGYHPRPVDTGVARWWNELDAIDVAFNIQHGRGGEDGVTQGLLEAMGIVCTGSDILGSALAMDKIRTKQLWRDAGLPTADFAVVDERTDPTTLLADWGSAFIKPSREGSSLGMSHVASVSDFGDAVREARKQDRAVLAERFIDGPEYTVAILDERALPAICIEVDGDFYDYRAKYESQATRYHVPCGLEPDVEESLAALCLEAFSALGCSVWGRVDAMRDSQGNFLLLEANTVPGMTSHSLVPMAARAAGLSMAALVEKIIECSLDQWEARRGQP